MIQNDSQILQLCKAGMIEPYHESCIRKKDDGVKVISYGVSSFGYDVTLADEAKIFINQNAVEIDPKNLDEQTLVDASLRNCEITGSRYFILPPNSYMLGYTKEYLVIPDDVMVVCVGKSTYARAGAIINVTPIEPGFEGNVVIEIANATTLPMRIYADEGIAQFLFFKGEPCNVSYADRKGKYQSQRGLTLPRV